MKTNICEEKIAASYYESFIRFFWPENVPRNEQIYGQLII